MSRWLIKDRTGQADILAKHCITDKNNRNE